MSLPDITAITFGVVFLQSYCLNLIGALSDITAPVDMRTYLQQHIDSLGALLFPVPKPKSAEFIDQLHAHVNDTDMAGDASDIIAGDMLRRIGVPAPDAISPLFWPIIETRAFHDGVLSTAITEIIATTLRHRMPGRYAVPNIVPSPEFWWTLILLFASATPTLPEAVHSRRWMLWRRPPAPPGPPPDHRLAQYEQRVLEIARQRAFADEMRWASFWEQWALLFSVQQTRGRHVDADIRARIVSLPLAKEILPSEYTGSIVGAAPPDEWRKTVPGWFESYDANWLRLA